MTQEDKELLLRDLCSRLPYFGLIVQYKGKDFNIIDIGFGRVTLVKPFMSFTSGSPLIEEIKPYLRPMSKMTEEEKKKLKEDTCPNGTGYFDEKYLICPMSHYGEQISYDFMSNILEWLNEHHFDYQHLIEKGLALEAPEDMYD